MKHSFIKKCLQKKKKKGVTKKKKKKCHQAEMQAEGNSNVLVKTCLKQDNCPLSWNP